MAHKTNNPMQEFGDQPFEQILRGYLQRGGTQAAPCAGFDAETANAYLEHALLAPTRQVYEAHLADCGNCRQHVTALARLNAELTPAPVIANKPKAITESLWMRWTAQAAAWWNELSHSLANNWGLASAGATACVLIAALAYYGVQQRTNNAALALAVADNASPTQMQYNANVRESAAPASAEMLASAPATAATVQRESVIAGNVAEASVATKSAQPSVSLPNLNGAPPSFAPSTFAAPTSATPVRVIEAPQDVIAFNSERPTAPVVVSPSNDDFFGAAPRQGGLQGTPVGFGQRIRLDSIESATPVSSLNVVKDQLERQSTLAEIAPVETRRTRLEEERKETKADKEEPGRARAILDALLAQRNALSFAPKKKADAPTKEADKTAETPGTRPMTKQVNGHTLYFERGFWIDANYKSDTTLPLIKLTRGSQRYQQILIENPMLEEFFQLAPVIVVWKNKVYEVRKGN